MADFFKNWRIGDLPKQNEKINQVSIDGDLQANIRKIEEDNKNYNESIAKSLYGQQQAYAEPFIQMMDTNPEFRDKRSYMKSEHNLHDVLKKFGNNPILNAIILTRANQVSMYCQPARYSEKGLGFEVRLRDLTKEPGRKEQEEIKRIEEFLLNTGTKKDVDRDSFQSFCKKIVRDTYIFDQVNFEKVFSKKNNTKLEKFIAVDPSTIFYATDKKGKIIKGGKRFVQVMDKKVVASFTSRELAMGIRNPRTAVESSGYGLSEVEIAMKEFIAYNNTESFNDRFFSHGGTTRGILQIRSDQQQSQRALENFKREWKSSLSGINGSWQIPVVMADDIKFVNMTPTANDMQFEKWLNYLINIIASLYGIDPAEIGFPNRGGATGSKGGSTLNEADPSKKHQASQNKGLQPLLRFIEDLINTHIISEYGDKYTFQFVGGDNSAEKEKIEILKAKTELGMTVNEAREALGLTGKLKGGDAPLNGAYVQYYGQYLQQEQYEEAKQKERFEMLQQILQGNNEEEDDQTVETAKVDNKKQMDGKVEPESKVGKDGQIKDQDNTNSKGVKHSYDKKDWKQ
ncbi:portal protein [Staphylococcus phage vB_SscM-1]|uniref:Portal protein n=2 Tax=Sciuriunavirus SscM1 TaxID=2734053 RepID=A0A1X9I9J5_9CAUD|nr:portal protein [Staphylococcus phage vB_SscM-1]ANT44754.1 portal protein [Staphylococcus phage vB_SscM-1]ANT44956.1 portal protein [Staphylococcus phage vB_SscM-2]